MNWQIIGPIGYLSIILSVAVLACWLAYWIKPRRLLANIGFLLALAAFFCALIHSNGYISRIDVDPAARIAEMEARQKAKEEALINSRSDEVARIRFAEDDQKEYLDTAGMDEADLKYMKAITESETPEWKKNRKERSTSPQKDDSLESKIGTEEASEGADVTELESQQKADPILLDEASVILARKLDTWNLNFSKILFWIAIAILLIDYLRRANRYQEASTPLPLPSAWLNAFTPLPIIHTRPAKPRRSMPEELKWLTRRGDAFIYFSDRPDQTAKICESLTKLKRWPYHLDLLVVDETSTLCNDFIFELLWYGRTSFIVDSPEKARQLLERFISRLEKRRVTKARSVQSVHLIWDIATPLPEDILQQFRKLAAPAGYSLLINQTSAL